MARPKRRFVCGECGATVSRWMGQCPSCQAWDSLEEEHVLPAHKTASASSVSDTQPRLLSEIPMHDVMRWDMGDSELNRVLGGGLVKGSLVLFGGAPGIGKSTLLLQTALRMKDCSILYVAGEESPYQIRMRAARLHAEIPSHLLLLDQTTTASVMAATHDIRPQLLIIDSLHTLTAHDIDAPAGSMAQLKAVTFQLMQLARELEVSIFLVGHVTKEGSVAGPRVVEHMVDTVLYLEGDRRMGFRLLRTVKNRFGTVSEIGVYTMTGTGLQPVQDPASYFLTERSRPVSGVAWGVIIEGIRPLLVEVQALTSASYYQIPQRATTGFDAKRLQMLLAVLEKRTHRPVGNQDIFVNITGGLRVHDPALDLAVIMALASSQSDHPLPPRTVFVGEVGLTGELRSVPALETRIQEALRHQPHQIILPASHYSIPSPPLQPYATVAEVIENWL